MHADSPCASQLRVTLETAPRRLAQARRCLYNADADAPPVPYMQPERLRPMSAPAAVVALVERFHQHFALSVL